MTSSSSSTSSATSIFTEFSSTSLFTGVSSSDSESGELLEAQRTAFVHSTFAELGSSSAVSSSSSAVPSTFSAAPVADTSKDASQVAFRSEGKEQGKPRIPFQTLLDQCTSEDDLTQLFFTCCENREKYPQGSAENSLWQNRVLNVMGKLLVYQKM